MQVVTIFGSNSGEKLRMMEEALKRLAQKAGRIVQVSSYYETEPWGFESKEDFLNRVVVFETTLSPETFLEACLETEKELGRVRSSGSPRYTSRPIDIDMLFYGNRIIHTPALVIPHPRLAERRFVLVPLEEIMPDFIHPEYGKTIRALLEACPDKLDVRKISGHIGNQDTSHNEKGLKSHPKE